MGNVDLAPTIAHIASAEPGAEVDGQSFLPLARFPESSDDRALLIESLVRDRSTDYGYPYAAVRDGHFIYIRYRSGEEELYNLARDPFELDSIAGDPAYAERKRSLADALDRLRDCRGEGCDVVVEEVGSGAEGRKSPPRAAIV